MPNCGQWSGMTRTQDLRRVIVSVNFQKFLRDTSIAVITLVLTSLTDWINNGGLTGTKYAGLAAILLVAIQAARRYLFPEQTTTAFLQASAFGVTTDAPPRLSLDFDTPLHGSFASAPDLGDDSFLASCAQQINAYSPAENGKVKSFDPGAIITILSYLLAHQADIEALVVKVKSWLGFLFRPRLRKAIVAAAVDSGNTEVARGQAPLVDGMESWLLKADAGVIRRARLIALGKVQSTFS